MRFLLALSIGLTACGANVVLDGSGEQGQALGEGEGEGDGLDDALEGGGTPGAPATYSEPTDCALADVAEHDDKCEAELHCAGGVVLDITCDGENDGTGTSLCTCFVGDAQKHGGLVEGERAAACANAVANCLEPTCCE